MKRIFILLTVLALCVSLFACTPDGGADGEGTGGAGETTTAPDAIVLPEIPLEPDTTDSTQTTAGDDADDTNDTTSEQTTETQKQSSGGAVELPRVEF